MIRDMIFIYCIWVSTQKQWSVNLYKNRRQLHKEGETIHKRIKNTEYAK